jgi:predicted alpha/beta hydrolase
MNSYAYTVAQLDLDNGTTSAVHRFTPPESTIPVLLLHGSIENGRIFYSPGGKGLAPFLARHGFDVFVPDMAGKGSSTPKIAKGFKHSQDDVIDRDIPIYIDHIRQYHPDTPIRLGAHSWGGVMLLAWYAKYGNPDEIGPSVFFGTKRRIGILSLRRFFMVDLVWSLAGTIGTLLKGYMPAVALRMGSENEPTALYKQVNRWVYSKTWKDEQNQHDYTKMLQNKALPNILYLAGIHDHVLGHRTDVRHLIRETGASNAHFMVLSKLAGNMQDYGHIDMLTSKSCPIDHFPKVVSWLYKGTLT